MLSELPNGAFMRTIGYAGYPQTDDPLTVSCILGVLALARGLRSIGVLIIELDQSELDELLDEKGLVR